MGNLTTLILIFPLSEDENDRIKEINEYTTPSGCPINLQRVGDYDGIKLWGTRDNVGDAILLGAYKEFDIENFFLFLQERVKWIDIQCVQVLVKSDNENEKTYNVYSAAGKTLNIPALKY